MNGNKTNDEDTSATSFNGERTRTEAAKAFSVPERKVRTAAQLDKAEAPCKVCKRLPECGRENKGHPARRL